MVECQLPKLDVVGSNPIARSIIDKGLEGLLSRQAGCNSLFRDNTEQALLFTSLPALVPKNKPPAAWYAAGGLQLYTHLISSYFNCSWTIVDGSRFQYQ